MAFYTADDIPVHKGDLVEFLCLKFGLDMYRHFAVYTETDVGDNVIQDRVGDRKTIGVVLPHDFKFFLSFFSFWFYDIEEWSIRGQCVGNGCRVNNLEEAAEARGLFAREPAVIIERAQAFFLQRLERRYNLLFENCEHFATKCRYETGFSDQVDVLFLKLFMPIIFLLFWYFEFSIILAFISIIAFDVFGKWNYLLKPLVRFFLACCSFLYFTFFPFPVVDTLGMMQNNVQQNEENDQLI